MLARQQRAASETIHYASQTKARANYPIVSALSTIHDDAVVLLSGDKGGIPIARRRARDQRGSISSLILARAIELHRHVTFSLSAEFEAERARAREKHARGYRDTRARYHLPLLFHLSRPRGTLR